MEHAQGYELRLASLKNSIDSFKNALEIDTGEFDGIKLDTLKSGQIQKFEVCVELFWKTTKRFLDDIHGIQSVSPKTTMKELYLAGYADEEQYELTIEMINDRNRLSHIYNEAQFNSIYKRLPEYLDIMRSLFSALTLP